VNEKVKPYYNGIFERNELAKKHLCSALMRFYVDIEFTGSHTQFYDKFNFRYYIAIIMKHLWKEIKSYHDSIEVESRDESKFVRFINMLLNDAIFLWDESITKLVEIRNGQTAMLDGSWNALDPNTRRDREDALFRLERQVRSFMMLANETFEMLHYLSKDIIAPFMRPELIDRLASMLNYFLSQLVGRGRELKVQNPEKYNFDPRMLIDKLVTVYTNFSRAPQFSEAVGRDGRSYNHETFVKATNILRSQANIAMEPIIMRFEEFVMQVQDKAKQEHETEEEIGEVPDEFLDPILSTLMTDPVILPTSGNTVDRSVITRHLLSDQTDPFNRAKLTVDMLKPNTALKEKIDAFLKSKKTKKTGEHVIMEID